MKLNSIHMMFGALALTLSGAAVAHHSPASYDLTKRATVSGVIKEAMFRNPHGRIVLVVKNGGKAEEWRVETSAANLLRRRGWDFSKFRPGATITLYGHMNKTAARDIYIREVKFADGVFFGDKEGNDKALD